METTEIREGTIAEAVALSKQLPEFIDPHGEERYHDRMGNVPHLILIAYVNNTPAAFKVGYEKEDYFYSWMGGVLPPYRRKGLAKQLAQRQEKWAKEKGYKKIVFKTRNRHKSMLLFALQNDFFIIGFKEQNNFLDNRILLQKNLY